MTEREKLILNGVNIQPMTADELALKKHVDDISSLRQSILAEVAQMIEDAMKDDSEVNPEVA